MRVRILIALAAMLVAASPASAHMLSTTVPPAKLSAKQQLRYATATISHARAETKLALAKIRYDGRLLHPSQNGWVLVRSSFDQQIVMGDLVHWKVVLYNHRYLLSFGERLRAQAQARLNPWKVPSWFLGQATCVHHGEGSWSSDTGNGFGGGLQFMVGTWNHAAALAHGKLPYVSSTGQIAAMPPIAQIYAAYLIVVVEKSGWGQWPNTARACGYL